MKAEKKVTPEVPESKSQKRGRKPKQPPVVYINLTDTAHYINMDNEMVSLDLLANWLTRMRKSLDVIKSVYENDNHLKILTSGELQYIAEGLELVTPDVKRAHRELAWYES